MNNGKPLIKCNIKIRLILLLLSINLLGYFFLTGFGYEEILYKLKQSPIENGLFLSFFIGLTFIIPWILLYYIKSVSLLHNGILINYPFRNKKKFIHLNELDNFKYYESHARVSMTEICIELKNHEKIKFNSASHTNFFTFLELLSKMTTMNQTTYSETISR